MPPRNPDSIITRLALQPIGARAVYHRGELAKDRRLDKAVNADANLAWLLAEQGHLQLSQRRLGEGAYEYIAKVIKPEKRK